MVKLEAKHVAPEKVVYNQTNILSLNEFVDDSNSEDDWSILHNLSIVESSMDEFKKNIQDESIKVLIIACAVDFLHREDVERIYSFSADESKKLSLKFDNEVKEYDASMWRIDIDGFDDVPISIIPLEAYLNALNCDAIGIGNHWINAILCHENGTAVEVS